VSAEFAILVWFNASRAREMPRIVAGGRPPETPIQTLSLDQLIKIA
jgi:hypothetical protein